MKSGSNKEVAILQDHRRKRYLFEGLHGIFPYFFDITKKIESRTSLVGVCTCEKRKQGTDRERGASRFSAPAAEPGQGRARGVDLAWRADRVHRASHCHHQGGQVGCARARFRFSSPVPSVASFPRMRRELKRNDLLPSALS
jgi:hypothetical protein